MIMTRVFVFVSLLYMLLSSTLLIAQGTVVISDLKPSNRRISFSLENIALVNFEFDPAVSIHKGKYVPHYYFFSNDTVIIDLRKKPETLNVGGRLDIYYYIDGNRRNTSKIIQPKSKMHLYIPRNKKDKVHAITVIMDENYTFTSPIQKYSAKKSKKF